MRPWPSSGSMGGSEAPDSISFNCGKVTATDRITGHQYPKSTHTPPSDFLFFCLLLGQALPVEAVSFISETLCSLALLLNFKSFMAHTPNVALIIVLFNISGTRAVLLAVSNLNPNEWLPNIQPPLPFRKHSYLCFSSTQKLSRTNCCLGTKKEHFN